MPEYGNSNIQRYETEVWKQGSADSINPSSATHCPEKIAVSQFLNKFPFPQARGDVAETFAAVLSSCIFTHYLGGIRAR